MRIKPVIVVIAFNRRNSLKRLLDSLANAQYPESEIPLIISIDKAPDNQNVLRLAEQFTWEFGNKKVIYQEQNLGLRKHVIQCASLSNEYGSVILLEDDLYVSNQFYNFACRALEFSLEKEQIGGISLYSHQFNVNAQENFSPIEDGFDNWYFQFASSWGQAWTREQWNSFYAWYLKNPELKPNPEVPGNITRWSSKSWLKYFIYYLVEFNKYFLYPKISLTTNFGDSGTHMDSSNKFQVHLDHSTSRTFTFSCLNSSQAVYDVFFENAKLYEALCLEKRDLCVDLYGSKPITNLRQRNLLSSKILDFKIERSFGRELKPVDANILKGIPGNEIFLYDIRETQKNPFAYNFKKHMMYQYKHLSRRNAKKLFFLLYKERIKRLFRDLLVKN
jgi:hypothetical protein